MAISNEIAHKKDFTNAAAHLILMCLLNTRLKVYFNRPSICLCDTTIYRARNIILPFSRMNSD